MVSSVTALVLATALGQAGARGAAAAAPAAADAAWLKAAPADAEIVLRVRGLKAGRDDLAKMIQAMSPGLGGQALPALDQGVDSFRQRYGDAAASRPFLVLVRVPKEPPGPGGPPPFAVMVESKNYEGVVKSASGLDTPKLEKQSGGYDKFDSKDGPMYAAKSGGFVVFGSDEPLVKAAAKPSRTLDATIDRAAASRLLAGDVGLFVNLAAIRERFGDQIDQARKQMTAQIEQQGANSPAGAAAVPMINGLFDALKNNKALAISLDFDAAGLTLAGDTVALTPKKAAAGSTGAETIAKLPTGAAMYAFFRGSGNSAMFEKLQRFSQAMATGEADSDAAKKARELTRGADFRDQVTAMFVVPKSPPISLNVATYGDARKGVDAMTAQLRSMVSDKGMIKAVDIKAGEQRYRGFILNHATTTPNAEKIKQMAAGAPLKGIGDTPTNTWYGTDGKVILAVAAPDWDKAKARIDAYLDGKQTVGQQAAYRTLRQNLPRSPGLLVVVEAQGLVHGIETLVGTMQGRDVPASDLPKQAAYFGLAAAPTENGSTFTFRLPSDVGPILEQGLPPLIGGLQAGRVNQ